MVIMTVDFIIPQAFAAAVAKMPSGGQSALLYFCMFGSLPCAIASLVIGLLALRQIRREKFLTGKKWAVCAITLGGLGLVFGVFLLIHFITLLQLTPPVPT
jgi:hypothetical protein